MNRVKEELMRCIGSEDNKFECKLECIEEFGVKELSMLLDFFDHIIILPQENGLIMYGKIKKLLIPEEDRKFYFKEWSKIKIKELMQKEIIERKNNSTNDFSNNIQMALFNKLLKDIDKDEEEYYEKIENICELNDYEKMVYQRLFKQFGRKSIRMFRRKDGLVDIIVDLKMLTLNTTELQILKALLKSMKECIVNILGEYEETSDGKESCLGLKLVFFKI